MIFAVGFTLAFALALTATILIRRLAWRGGVLDMPKPDIPRKIHKVPTPLLGGLAVILAFDLVTAFFYFWHPLLAENIPLSSMVAIWAGSVILAIGGVIDDKKNLPPGKIFVITALATLAVVVSGMNVPHITNPLGGQIILSGPTIFGFSVISVIFVSIWILGMIYTTKFLDGLDGLASSIALVAGLALFALSFTPNVNQPYTALLIAIFVGAVSGFLVFNWHPAKIFLGESGSTFLGFALGVFSIIAGVKIATAFLVMGIPILDVAWVIARRIRTKLSPFKGDRGHLHFRLLDLGLKQSQIVFIFMAFSAVFGSAAVFLQSLGKLLVLGVLFLIMLAFGAVVVILGKRRTKALLGLKESASASLAGGSDGVDDNKIIS